MRSARIFGRASRETRLSTTAVLMPRSFASTRVCHARASPYREAVVTKSQKSAASSNRREISRLFASTESRSGASTRMSPGIALSVTTTRPISAIAWSSMTFVSFGWTDMTGVRVVGRMTDAGEMSSPSSELNIVDFPAPEDPPRTVTVGSPSVLKCGRILTANCVRSRLRASFNCIDPGRSSGKRALSSAEIVRAMRPARSLRLCGVFTRSLSAIIRRE